jgi:hypothetical protein
MTARNFSSNGHLGSGAAYLLARLAPGADLDGLSYSGIAWLAMADPYWTDERGRRLPKSPARGVVRTSARCPCASSTCATSAGSPTPSRAISPGADANRFNQYFGSSTQLTAIGLGVSRRTRVRYPRRRQQRLLRHGTDVLVRRVRDEREGQSYLPNASHAGHDEAVGSASRASG